MQDGHGEVRPASNSNRNKVAAFLLVAQAGGRGGFNIWETSKHFSYPPYVKTIFDPNVLWNDSEVLRTSTWLFGWGQAFELWVYHL